MVMRTIKLPRLLQPYYCSDLIRVGKDNDGGYLVNKSDILKSECLLSFGINDDWSFEEQFLNINNCPLYGYDNSVNDEMLKDKGIYESHKQFFTGTKQHIAKNIGKRNSDEETTFDQVMKDKGDNIFLKCDIEGSEYDILDNIIIHTKKFSGIVIEFHDIQENYKLNEMANFVSKLDQKLVHVHINNYTYTQVGQNEFIPSVVELTFTSSENIKLKKHITFPNSLDMPNCPEREDFTIIF
jgi:hypothetical protein